MDAARFWWLWLLTGLIWIIVSLIILQFDTTSATTIGSDARPSSANSMVTGSTADTGNVASIGPISRTKGAERVEFFAVFITASSMSDFFVGTTPEGVTSVKVT